MKNSLRAENGRWEMLALMHAVLSLTNIEKEKWAYGKHNGLVTFNEWLGKFAKRARRDGDDEDAMTALKVIQSIPLISS